MIKSGNITILKLWLLLNGFFQKIIMKGNVLY